jgi:protein-tyrosine phosphatase
MTRILMVCLGNICRSPLAHGILESKLPTDKFFVDSAGTASYHIGSQPDRRSITVGKQNYIDIDHQTARQFSVSDFERFDIIYAMDQSNYFDIVKLAQYPEHRQKVKLILDENPVLVLKDVPDPYYGDLKDFESVFQLLDDTCTIIARRLNE